jgi:iron(III) transport system substrate-binding protein
MSHSRARRALLLPLLALVAACTTTQPVGVATPTASTPAGTTSASPSGSPDASPTSGTTGSPASGTLTVYSGRTEELVGPVIAAFEAESGIDVQVKYGDTAELAAALLEEGERSPADVFLAQDAGALGAVAAAGSFAALPPELLELVPATYRSTDGLWVGVTGRSRVAAYDSSKLQPGDLPASILGFTDPKWKGRIGWAPTNGSFQAFVTALRKLKGEEAARAWLEGVKANEPRSYPRNAAIIEAIANGEIEVGFVNHYYLLQALAEQGDLKVANHFFAAGDPGSLVNVAGVGVLGTARNPDAARAFVEYLLGTEAQTHFARETFEYPLIEGVERDPRLKPLTEITPPDLDLNQLSDLEATLRLLQETGVL